MRRTLALVLLVAALVIVRPNPVGACSCSPFDATQALAGAEGAFIGRLTVRREAPPDPGEGAPDRIGENAFVYQFRVDQSITGTFPSEVEVRSGEGGGDCGIETPIGAPVGLFVGRWRGLWVSELCSQIEPERLRRAATPVPVPDGQPPPWLVVGTTYGGGRVVSLDGRGRVIAFGEGPGLTTVISVCPESERMVEVAVPPESDTNRDPLLTVRSLDRLAIQEQVPLPGFGPSGGVYREVEAVVCRDATADDVVLFVREDSPDYQSRIVELRGARWKTLWRGTATHGAFRADGRLAYVTSGRRGIDLLVVELTANPPRVRSVARIPEDPASLAIGPDGTVALPTGGGSSLEPGTVPLVIVTVHPSTGVVRRATVPDETRLGTVVWAPDRRLLLVPEDGREPVRVYDDNLNELASWRGLESSRVIVDTDRLVSLAQGVVWSAPVNGGPVTRIAELGDGLPGTISVVPTRTSVGRSAPEIRGPDRGSARTIAALAAVLLAGTVIAVWAFSRKRLER